MIKIHELNVNGQEIMGTTREIAIVLRQEPHSLSMGKIAELIGQTRSNIHRVLKDTVYAGRLRISKPKLTPAIFRSKRDEEVAEEFGVPLTYVIDRRKELGIRLPPKINLERRQLLLCGIVFGQKYVPGRNFSRIMEILVNNLLTTKLQRDLIMGFYFGGGESSNTDKVYRHGLRQQIKIYVANVMEDGDLQKIISQGGIIQQNM